MSKRNVTMESILDINSSNIWTLDEFQLATLWEHTKAQENFASSEEKLLNTIRLAFEVVHYNAKDPREVKKYEDGKWALVTHCEASKGNTALRQKVIRKL